MTIDLRFTIEVEGGGNGHSIRAGTGGIPVELAGGTELLDRTLVVDTTGSTLFDNSTDLDSFDALIIIPQATVLAEFTVGAADTKMTFKLLAGLPFVLGSDDAAAAITASLETIKLINVKAATGTASVRLLAVT